MLPRRWLGLVGLGVLLGGLVLLGRQSTALDQTQILAVGVLPTMAAVDARTQHAFVANSGDNTVSLLDLSSGRVLRTVAVGPSPTALTVDERRGRVLVLNSDNTVSILDTDTGLLLRTAAVGSNPMALAIDGRSGHAFVANSGDDTLSLLDVRTGRLLRTVRVGDLGTGAYVVVDALASRVLVGNRGDPHLTVVDTWSGTVLGALHSDDGITTVGVDGRTGRAFVLHSSDNRLSVVDTRHAVVVRTVRIGAGATSVVVDERAGHAFVANSGDGTISLLDARTGLVLRTIALRAADQSATIPVPLVVDALHHHVFVLNAALLDRRGAPSSDRVSMLDSGSGQVLRQWGVGVGSVALAMDAPPGRLLVVNQAMRPLAPSGMADSRLRTAWQWAPQPLRRWLPWLAPPVPRLPSGTVTVVGVAPD